MATQEIRLEPEDLKAAREKLELSQAQLARLVGYGGANVGQRISAMENGVRPVAGHVARLVAAYLDGHRPADWPDRD